MANKTLKYSDIILLLCFSSLIIFSSQETITKKDADKCYVLALEGGGDHGAYQAGAIKGLADNLPADEAKWSVITGISAGTLNGSGLSLFDIGDEKAGADFLVSVWRDLEGKNSIYRNWKPWGALGPFFALFYKSGFYDTTPEKELLNEILDGRTIKRDLYIGITNIRTGGYEVVSAKGLSKEDFVQSIMSSSAIPVIFPAVEYLNKDLYADGGVKHGIDILTGINVCKEKGYKEEDIVVDIVLCFGRKLEEVDPTKQKSMNALLRMFAIWNYDRGTHDVDETIHSFPNVKFRYLVKPTKDLPNSTTPLIFDKEELEFMINVGIQDAKDLVQASTDNFSTVVEMVEEYRKERMTTKRAVPNIDN